MNAITNIFIRLKFLSILFYKILKISYKKNTLTWYRSFKQNFFVNNKNINLNHKRIMKRIYNNVISFIISFVLVFPLLMLLALKYVLNVVVKILKAVRTIIQVSIVYIRTLKEELEKVLSVRD